MSHIVRLDDPACLDARRFGGKAAGLARLTAEGMPVAHGFAVDAGAHRAVRAAGDRPAWAPVPAAVADEIRAAYRRLGPAGDVPVAVRSSATAEDSARASFAGGFDTVVGVRGADEVLDAVRRCWAGASGERAVEYARANGIDPDTVSMGVVVQRMVRADAAGVMFTISPVTGDRSRIVVEASWGLGLAVVGGEVTPERWVVDKIGLTVLDHDLGDKRVEYREDAVPVEVDPARRAAACLTDDQVLDLARLGKRLERRLGGPQDVEFAVEDGVPVLVQCRPETVWSSRAQRSRFTPGHGPARWITSVVTPGVS